ncbi:hypothetical protein Tco_1197801, partial [Tanacetum coccineum]
GWWCGGSGDVEDGDDDVAMMMMTVVVWGCHGVAAEGEGVAAVVVSGEDSVAARGVVDR